MTGSIRVPLELAQSIIAGRAVGFDIVEWFEAYMGWNCDNPGVRDKSMAILHALNETTNIEAFGQARWVCGLVLPDWRIYEIHEVSNWGTQGPCFPTNVCKVVLYNLEQSCLGKPYLVVGKADSIAAAFVVAILKAVGGRGEVVVTRHPIDELVRMLPPGDVDPDQVERWRAYCDEQVKVK